MVVPEEILTLRFKMFKDYCWEPQNGSRVKLFEWKLCEKTSQSDADHDGKSNLIDTGRELLCVGTCWDFDELSVGTTVSATYSGGTTKSTATTGCGTEHSSSEKQMFSWKTELLTVRCRCVFFFLFVFLSWIVISEVSFSWRIQMVTGWKKRGYFKILSSKKKKQTYGFTGEELWCS